MTKVTFELENGKKMSFVLCPEHAAATVENFVALVKKGYYNGLCFHRVIEGFIIQGGGFTHSEDALDNAPATRSIKGEFSANGVDNPIKHEIGVISMARTSVPDSASSQFFICTANAPFLDGQYAAFGRAADEETKETAIEISKVKTHSFRYYNDVPVLPVVIKSATVTEENE